MLIEPKACPRPRVKWVNGRPVVYYPKSYYDWRKRAKPITPTFEPPDYLKIVFVIKRPKNMKKGGRVPHSKRPDLDNFLKSIFDVFYFDDCMVHTLDMSKVYGATGEEPCIELDWGYFPGEKS